MLAMLLGGAATSRPGMAAGHPAAGRPRESPPRWETLPPTPSLPNPARDGVLAVNDVEIYQAEFGAGDPVICLHGGLASSRWWGHLVPELARDHRVIVMDTRGHGRSSRVAGQLSYELMAGDVAAVLQALRVDRATVIGWSDGAIAGLQLAVTNPGMVARLYAFGLNFTPGGLRPNGAHRGVFPAFVARCRAEYDGLPGGQAHGWTHLTAQLAAMWRSSPDFQDAQLASVRLPVTVSDGEHDEIIERRTLESMARHLPEGRVTIQPAVSHFAMVQDPAQFARDVRAFLR